LRSVESLVSLDYWFFANWLVNLNKNITSFPLSFFERLTRDQNSQFWLFQTTFWFFWASYHLIFNFSIPIILADAIVAAILTSGLAYLYQRVWERAFFFRVLVIILGSAIAGLAWNIFKRHLELSIGDENYLLYKELGTFSYYTYEYLGLSFWVVLSWSGLYYGLTLYFLLQEERAASLNAKAMAHEAQIRMLRYQLNPHFLFNTLNAISTLILEADMKTSNAMVSKLSNFLRYSLEKDPLQKVNLNHEINTLQLYLDIEKVRFEERLGVEYRIDEQAGQALIPSMLLQPLVENAIKYAVADRIEGGTIEIDAEIEDGQLVIVVRDDGPGLPLNADGSLPDFKGVGIKNIRERLRELYGADHLFAISSNEPHGLKIEIRLPFEMETRSQDSTS
jgi:sensor histidine kinase YesM